MTDNRSLQQAVLEELDWEPSVHSADIGVTANDGVVSPRPTEPVGVGTCCAGHPGQPSKIGASYSRYTQPRAVEFRQCRHRLSP